MKLGLSAKLYIGIVALLSFWVLMAYAPQILQFWSSDFLKALVIFSALAFFTQLYEVEVVYKRMISIGFSVFLATVLVGGAQLAIAVALISTLTAEIILRWNRLAEGVMNFFWRVSFNTGQVILATFIASQLFELLGGNPFLTLDSVDADQQIFYNQLIPAVGAFVASELVNNALVAGVISLTQQTSFTYHMQFNLKYLPVQVLSLGILGILMAVVYAQSPWNLFLVLVPLGLVHVSLRNYMKLRYEANKTFQRISEMLDARDRYTYEHSQGVSHLAERIAHQLNLDQDGIERVKSAAVIHDIGKVAVPDRILQKPGPLTDEEKTIMRKHPDTGADLLRDLEIYRDIVDIVRSEHEHWDGSGYPKGLKGEEIPIEARIVAAADIYHALTTDRPYRTAYSHEEALEIMRGMSGAELDPRVVDALIKSLESNPTRQTPTQSKTPG
jgi:putative nucleotidyltransferase with HDIG domain